MHLVFGRTTFNERSIIYPKFAISLVMLSCFASLVSSCLLFVSDSCMHLFSVYRSEPYFLHVFPADDPSDKYYEEMQTRITDLSLLLFDKLEFLEVSKKGLTNFQVMFIELEVRMLFLLVSSLKVCLFQSVQLTYGRHKLVGMYLFGHIIAFVQLPEDIQFRLFSPAIRTVAWNEVRLHFSSYAGIYSSQKFMADGPVELHTIEIYHWQFDCPNL